jgi:hypothetical protein
MLTTSIAWLAFATAAANTSLNVQTDYAAAYTAAVEQHRPLAVFINDGKGGPASLVTNGLSDAANKLLAENYVTVYIDASTEAGKKVAATFDLNQGLVISNRTGDKQALRLTGTVSTADLDKSLEKFAKADVIVNTTQTTANPKPYCPTGKCPFARD